MKEIWEKGLSRAGSNFGLKFLSVALAMGLWLAGHRDIERAVEAPVEFRNLPSDLMVTENRVDYVVVRLMGPRTLVSTLGPENLRLRLDLEDSRPGPSSFPLGPDSFNPPRGVRIARISPSVVHLRLEPVAERALPVIARFAGTPPFGYKISSTAVEPQSVMVRGPASEVKRMVSVETVPIELEGAQGAVKRKVRLSADGKPLSFSPERVAVSVELEEEWITREYLRVGVRFSGSGEFSTKSRTVDLRLSGPKRVLGKLGVESIQAYLDLEGLPAGEHALPLRFDLPPEVRVLEQKPERFKVKVKDPTG